MDFNTVVTSLFMVNNSDNQFTNWEARPGWLILLPSRTPPKRGALFIPETATKKSNSGICIKAGYPVDEEVFQNKECFFPTHSEYQVNDSDTGFLIYIVPAEKIILIRTPPPDIAKFSREKAEGVTFQTLTHSEE
jgi:hypothetical protein